MLLVDSALMKKLYFLSVPQSIPSSMTSYVAADLVPGVSYSLTLHSSNLAGLSDPTPTLSHDTARGGEGTTGCPLYTHAYICFHCLPAAPRLEFFTAESLGDGRSILLQWRLEYSGGEDITSFYIEVQTHTHCQ